MKSCCVFCGSSPGARPEYREAAVALGREIAGRGLRLVYGGASVGLMGAVADAAIEAGGEVVGVIPHALAKHEVMHHGWQDAPLGPDYAATLAANYLENRKISIYGGSNEIQRSVLSQAALGRMR